MKPGSGTLVIDISGEKAEAYEGTYQCTAHNEHGTAVSNSIVIRQSSKACDFIISFQLWLLVFSFHKRLKPNTDLCQAPEWEPSSVFVRCLCDSQGPPCGRRRETRQLRCKWGAPWCWSAVPLQGCRHRSSSGWITVRHFHTCIYTTSHWMLQNRSKDCATYTCTCCSMSNSLCVPHSSDFQRLPLDQRVSQALNGDLYFSNVLPEDTRSDYICYARFPHTQTIQQKQPISVTVLDSE